MGTLGRTYPATGTPDHSHHSKSVRYFRLREGYDLVGLKDELHEYRDVLLGRVPPPVDRGILTLMEVAEAYHARAKDIEMELLDLEAEGAVLKDSAPYKFRVGQLRKFIELVSKIIELGSRRVTYARLESEGMG
jgi:hypothetical protein